MRPVLLVILVTASCERAPDADSESVRAAPVPTITEAQPGTTVADPSRLVKRFEPAVTPAPVAEAPVTPPPVAHRRAARSVPVPDVADLPTPPSQIPSEYRAWLRTQTAEVRASIQAYCGAHPRDFQEVCGGIGPLHITKPPYGPGPRMVGDNTPPPPTFFSSISEWRASLSRAQLAYVDRECRRSDGDDDLCQPDTPLVIAFDNKRIDLSKSTTFAFQPGDARTTAWPSAKTPWLVLDRDGDGAITSGRELFGDATLLSNGASARNGFEALAELDDNHDGRITRADLAFERLQLWADRDGNGTSERGELTPAGSRIVSIELAYESKPTCDYRGNCERERAKVTWRGDHGSLQTGSVVDLYLARTH